MKRCLFLCLLTFVSGLVFGKQKVTIHLQSAKMLNTIAYLTLQGETDEPIDSIQIKDGGATKQLVLDDNEIYRIVVPAIRFGRYVIPEAGNILIDLDSGELKGTPLNESYYLFSQQVDAVKSTEEYVQIMVDNMRNHPNDPIGTIAFHNYLLFAPKDSVVNWYDRMGKCVHEAKMVQQQMRYIVLQQETAVGKKYKDVVVGTQRLSNYVAHGNKITVIDFWASWCSPCLYSFSYLNDIYARYHDKGIEIVGIAIQDESAKSKAAIAKYNVHYPQIYDAGTAASELYGAQGVPLIVIVAADGTILARDVRADKLEEVLVSLLDSENN